MFIVPTAFPAGPPAMGPPCPFTATPRSVATTPRAPPAAPAPSQPWAEDSQWMYDCGFLGVFDVLDAIVLVARSQHLTFCPVSRSCRKEGTCPALIFNKNTTSGGSSCAEAPPLIMQGIAKSSCKKKVKKSPRVLCRGPGLEA